MQLPHDLLFAYLMSVFALACTPGVASAALARNTLHRGEAAGVNLAMGILLARLSKTGLAVVSLAHMADLLSVAGFWLKLGGGAYLGVVGYRVIFGTRYRCPGRETGKAPGHQFAKGFLLSWSNPSALFFVVIVLPRFVDQSTTLWQQLLLLGVLWALVALIVELLLVACTARLSSGKGAGLIACLSPQSRRCGRVLLGTLLLAMACWLVAGP